MSNGPQPPIRAKDLVRRVLTGLSLAAIMSFLAATRGGQNHVRRLDQLKDVTGSDIPGERCVGTDDRPTET